MSKDTKELLMKLQHGMGEFSKGNLASMEAFSKFVETTLAPSALDTKTKELIGIGISVFCHCEYCIVAHVKSALEAGATREEIMEAAMVAVVFGGGPATAYASAVLVDALDTFEGEKE
jgi:AhpD family alkylhydroperoxidase